MEIGDGGKARNLKVLESWRQIIGSREAGGRRGILIRQSWLFPGPNLTHISRFTKAQDAGLAPTASDLCLHSFQPKHQLVHIDGFPQSFDADPGKRSRSFFASSPCSLCVLPPT